MRSASGCIVALLAGGLAVIGLAGGQAAAGDAFAQEAASPVAQELDSNPDAVVEAQRVLAELGYDPGPADGAIGPRTRSAIRAFQSDWGITADGVVSAALLGQLAEALAEAERDVHRGSAAVAADESQATPAMRERSPDEVHACDLLAATRRDRHAVAEGIEDVDGPLALDACRRARAEFPDVARFAYQEARALEKLERYAEARAILEQLADANYPMAQSSVGSLQERGLGFPKKDLREAVAWYRRAADLGEPWAQARLGRALAEGEGGLRRNDGEALRWFRAAAENDVAYAEAFIGYFHEAGRGVPVDTAEALRWYRQAAEGGDKWALEQVERFDSAGAREIREALRQREETKRAEIAARKREAETLLAAEAHDLPDIAKAQPPRLFLGEAIEDLSWALAEKIDADFLAVARALREARDETDGTEIVFERLTAVAQHAASNEDHSSAPGVASFWWRLALASAAGGRSEPAPVDTAQARLMVEVASRYGAPADQDTALQLYLLGFRDLDSPIVLPAWIPDSTEAQLSSAHAAAQHLRERLETLGEQLKEKQLSAEVEVEPLAEQLGGLTEEIVASRSGVVEIAAIGDSPWDRQLGAIGGLANFRGQLASRSTTEETVSLVSDLEIAPGDGFQIASLSVAGRMEDGMELARAAQQFLLPVGASLPDVSGVSEVDVHALRRELAEAMLVALPLELANLWWVTEDIIEEIGKVFGQPEPNPWLPHFDAAGTATEPVATADSEPETVAARSDPQATAIEPADAPPLTLRMARVGLRDGSTVAAGLIGGTLTFKSAFGYLPVRLDNLADLSEGQLKLNDGTVLPGELVSGEIVIAIGSGERKIAAADIVTIAILEEGVSVR